MIKQSTNYFNFSIYVENGQFYLLIQINLNKNIYYDN